MQKKRTSSDELIAMIAHDFLSPLYSIQGYIEVLKLTAENKLSSSEKHNLENINALANDSYETLKTIVTLFKKQELPLETIKVASFMRNLQKVLKADLDDKKITLVLKNDIQTLKTKPGILKQLLLNLVKNAIAASPKGSSITLCFHEKTITLEDCGPGIDLSLPHFQKKPTVKPGIGLYIIENCLSFLNANIKTQKLSTGTMFTITLL